MRYGYTRTSSADKQRDNLQRDALLEAGVDPERIFSDQTSGTRTTSSRPGWSALKDRLRPGDELIVWRIDRIDPSTTEGRFFLNLMASFAEYERALIQERVQAGVDAARSRGVRFGRPAVDPVVVARKLRLIEQLIEEEQLSVVEAAKTQGWSKATYYRHRAEQNQLPDEH